MNVFHPVAPTRSPTRRRWMRGAARAVGAWVLIPLVLPPFAAAAGGAPAATGESVGWPPSHASGAAQQLVRWVAGTADNQNLPFAVIDKIGARIHVFSARSQWLGSSAVLLGAARGDRSAPDIGYRPLSQIPPQERTTPAGRFVTEPGRNLHGDAIVWIDYDAAVSLHPVRSVSASERRGQRLASPGLADKRISYGCVNAPQRFYHQFIAPSFGQSPGVIYILPDTEPFATFFGAASAYE